MAEQTSTPERRETDHNAVAQLNDQLRADMTRPGHNRVVMTAGIAELVGDTSLFRGFHRRANLLRAVRDFDSFDRDNDPYGHRDLGAFDFESVRCLWKIDYYDRDLTYGSEDPADPLKTTRVLTILRADEW